MTVVSLERSRWPDTVEISKCCNVLGDMSRNARNNKNGKK